MKNLVKYAAIGVAGYALGFYEMKYRVMKVLLESQVEKKKKEEEEA